MKNAFLLALLYLSFGSLLHAQKSCCTPAGNDLAILATNENFKTDHKAPKPFSLEDERGKGISFKTADGKMGSAYYIPARSESNKVLLVFHEWWGLNDYIKNEAEKWFDKLGGIHVLAIDLYDGQIASDAGQAGKLMGNLNEEHARAVINGIMDYVGRDKEIYTLGWCMGGTWSFEAALLAGKQAKACVMYYGFPKKDASKIKKMQSDVLYIHGTRDPYITAQAVEDFGSGVRASGHKFELHSYDAVHAFANPSNPDFDKQNAGDAEAKTLAFLLKSMK
ncbi:MAG: dienelactone hydrolase family protein [Bacteroidetes bacterium]|nr:dienelactone hydrolase family protein [Bacteroidota bacterium]